ncbi:MAG: IPT/TIG domain-containing protein, partial [Treponema sp.]|nr:IPT/TIG domain-containing protein [Treponema sp.]
MNSSSELYYLLRKSPLVRMSLLFAFVLLVIGISVLANIRISRRPVITEINPPVGGPGDVISISGKHFGINRDSSYVEFNGNRLTSSAYIAWTDSQIKVIIPSNIQDGLVVVGANNNRSRPAFFTNERDIPLIARQRQPGAMPFISNVSKANISIGELIVLQGDNFGSQGESSAVYFSSERAERSQGVSANPNAQRLTHIPASTTMLDYEYWSNTEIRVYVPDGAKSGTVYVETPAGKSAEYTLNVTSNVG